MNATERKLVKQYRVLTEDAELQREAALLLTNLFPKQKQEPVYSIGFQRWDKLTRKQREKLFVKFNFDSNAVKDALQTKTAIELLN